MNSMVEAVALHEMRIAPGSGIKRGEMGCEQQTRETGFSLLEILLSVGLSAGLLVASLAVLNVAEVAVSDAQNHVAVTALLMADSENTRAAIMIDYLKASRDSVGLQAGVQLARRSPLAGMAQCAKLLGQSAAWTSFGLRNHNTQLPRYIFDRGLALDLSGCDAVLPVSSQSSPEVFGPITVAGHAVKGVSIALGRAYVRISDPPFLMYVDPGSVVQSDYAAAAVDTSMLELNEAYNDLQIIRGVDGKWYGLAAVDAGVGQLQILDLTDPLKPKQIVRRSLLGVSGSYPQGWRVRYFGGRIYIWTRFTAGPELHVFQASDLSNAASILEIGTKDLARTAEDMIIIKHHEGAAARLLAYMATDKDSSPLSVYEVTAPSAISELVALEPLSVSYHDGNSLALIANRLYLARSSNPATADIFVYDITDPWAGGALPLIDSLDVATGPLSLAASGERVYFTAPKKDAELQGWTRGEASWSQMWKIPLGQSPGQNSLTMFQGRLYVADGDKVRVLRP